MKKLGITLLTKGSAVVFHRKEFVNLLQKYGYEVTFVCAQGAHTSLRKMKDCRYVDYDLELKCGFFRYGLISICRYIRAIYPSASPQNSRRNGIIQLIPFQARKLVKLMLGSLCARRKYLVLAFMKLEQFLVRGSLLACTPDAWNYDVLLAGGLGQKNSITDGFATIFARSRCIRVVNVVINYDALTAKGFRGCDLDSVIVWGESMRQDLIRMHCLRPEIIHKIGSLRYQFVQAHISRSDFLREKGLSEDSRIVYYCTSIYPVHTLEVLRAYDELLPQHPELKLVIRFYPGKQFLESTFLHYLQDLLKTRPGVMLDYSMKSLVENDSKEFLELIDQDYWYYLKYADVVINYYSSVTIDSLVFAKSSICIDYYPEDVPFIGGKIACGLDNLYIHHVRAKSYNVTRYAQSRDDLRRFIEASLQKMCAPAALEAIIFDERGPITEDFSEKLLNVLNSSDTKIKALEVLRG